MKTWLRSILFELDHLTSAEIQEAAPSGALDAFDHVVGIANNDLCRGYALLFKRKKQAEAALDELKLGCCGAECTCLEKEMRFMKLRGEVHALDTAFWTDVRMEYSELADKQHIGIRDGWSLVWNDRPISPPQSFSEGLLFSLLLAGTMNREDRATFL